MSFTANGSGTTERRAMVVRYGWLSIVGFVTGCVGQAPALPEPMGLAGNESSGSDMADSANTTSGHEPDTIGPSSQCGNGEVDPGEECDGSTLNVQTCMSLGFDGGRLTCDQGCQLVDHECFHVCGDGEADPGEECDGTDLNAQTCTSLGYSGSGLSCSGCQLNASECGPIPGMVEIPGGPFTMGSTTGGSDEQPVRDVQVDRFWIDETEVTVSAYQECVDAGACDDPDTITYCNWMVVGRESHPVNCVDWFQANAYCGWAGGAAMKRLPTEAEWEKAARGTDEREYPWGESPAPSCGYVVMNDGGGGCGTDATIEVGSKPPGNSPYGARDMSGNVWEWVWDRYEGSYHPEETNNPTGPARGTSRVLRGGSWGNSSANNFRTAYRDGDDPTSKVPYVGFRCASTPPSAP